MKHWIIKLINQLDMTVITPEKVGRDSSLSSLSEDKATLLFVIDTYNKNLFEIDNYSVRKVREKLDELSKALVSSQDNQQLEIALFEIRQFFSTYRVNEYSYIQNTFDDFKKIVWNFADQLSESIQFENTKEKLLSANLKELKDAVEANSLEVLKQKSREFIQSYIDYQNQKKIIRNQHMEVVKKDLSAMKKQLLEANVSLNFDHLTSAHNRRSFEDHVKKVIRLNNVSNGNYSMLMLDIDFFKKINDSYGHDVGDFVIKECVKLLFEVFSRSGEIVARVGGEEFAVVLPNHSIQQACVRAQETLERVRSEVFIHGEIRDLRFTISIGIAQLAEGENASEWVKRADQALYDSKNSGRNKYSLAELKNKDSKVA